MYVIGLGMRERCKQEGAKIDSSCTSGTSTLETFYSNFIARQLYAQKCILNIGTRGMGGGVPRIKLHRILV